jgi:hypothetical protein
MTTTPGTCASPPRDPQEHATAEQIGHGNPRWLILWGTHSRLFWAFARFGAAPGTIITAPAIAELLDSMRQAELTAATSARPRP